MGAHPNPEWRQRWIDKAEEWQDKIPEATAFLKKVYRKAPLHG
jgi:hypothetical protein